MTSFSKFIINSMLLLNRNFDRGVIQRGSLLLQIIILLVIKRDIIPITAEVNYCTISLLERSLNLDF